MIRTFLVSLLLLAGCHQLIVSESVAVDGVMINVNQRDDGTWVGTPGRPGLTYPASNIPLYIRAIEGVSGCRVNRDAMTTEVWIVEAAVIC